MPVASWRLSIRSRNMFAQIGELECSLSAFSQARREYMHPDREPNISRPGLANSVNNHITVVFLNFSDGANPHQSVRFSNSALRLPCRTPFLRSYHLTRQIGIYPAPRARLNLTPNLLSPSKHINSDWVRVCWRSWTSYGTFFSYGFQRNCARGHTGHITKSFMKL